MTQAAAAATDSEPQAQAASLSVLWSQAVCLYIQGLSGSEAVRVTAAVTVTVYVTGSLGHVRVTRTVSESVVFVIVYYVTPPSPLPGCGCLCVRVRVCLYLRSCPSL